MAEKKYTPILPFDGTIGENFIIYDNQTYHQNINYITPESVKKDSGNIIKRSEARDGSQSWKHFFPICSSRNGRRWMRRNAPVSIWMRLRRWTR